MNKAFFVTGTGTGVGKTFVGSLLIKMIKADGFSVCPIKPVETGVNDTEKSDMDILLESASLKIPVRSLSPYRLQLAASPNLAARQEGIEIEEEILKSPIEKYRYTFDYTLVEGCGGLMVPLNEKGYFVFDFIKNLEIPVILVASRILGTINHTMLSIELCKNKKIPLAGIIFCDTQFPKDKLISDENVRIIKSLSQVPIIGHIPYSGSKDCSEIEKNLDTFIERKLFYSLII